MRFRKLWSSFALKKPWHPFALIFVLVLTSLSLIFFVNYSVFNFDWDGVYVEAFGMLFDIIFLGIIWAIIDNHRIKKLEKKRLLEQERLEIKRYEEELDDFRDWESQEASRRLSGIIRRLNNKGVYDFALNCCYLNNGNLWDLKCTYEAAYVDFSGANLRGAILQNISLDNSSFENADLLNAKFNGSCLSKTNFERADLYGADFRGCKDIDKAFFWAAKNIWTAKFDEDVDIEKLKKQKKQLNRFVDELGKYTEIKSFFEKKFNCSILDFEKEKDEVDCFRVEFTKEYFSNYKNLIEIIEEDQHYFCGLINIEELVNEQKK